VKYVKYFISALAPARAKQALFWPDMGQRRQQWCGYQQVVLEECCGSKEIQVLPLKKRDGTDDFPCNKILITITLDAKCDDEPPVPARL
jgi:hypothetical protein